MAKNGRFTNDMKFINRTLTAAEDEAFVKWANDKSRVADTAVETAFADMYRVSLNFDAINNCFIASLTYKGEKGDNLNKCLTARSDSYLEAMFMVVYKHDVIFKRGEWEETGGGRQRG